MKHALGGARRDLRVLVSSPGGESRDGYAARDPDERRGARLRLTARPRQPEHAGGLAAGVARRRDDRHLDRNDHGCDGGLDVPARDQRRHAVPGRVHLRGRRSDHRNRARHRYPIDRVRRNALGDRRDSGRARCARCTSGRRSRRCQRWDGIDDRSRRRRRRPRNVQWIVLRFRRWWSRLCRGGRQWRQRREP